MEIKKDEFKKIDKEISNALKRDDTGAAVEGMLKYLGLVVDGWSIETEEKPTEDKVKECLTKKIALSIVLDANGLINSIRKNLEVIEEYEKFPRKLVKYKNGKWNSRESVTIKLAYYGEDVKTRIARVLTLNPWYHLAHSILH